MNCYSHRLAIHEIFAANAKRIPDKPCVIETKTSSVPQRIFSCRQINESSNQLAHHLVAHGCDVGDILMMCAYRGLSREVEEGVPETDGLDSSRKGLGTGHAVETLLAGGSTSRYCEPGQRRPRYASYVATALHPPAATGQTLGVAQVTSRWRLTLNELISALESVYYSERYYCTHVHSLGMYLAYLVAVWFLPAPAEEGEYKLPKVDETRFQTIVTESLGGRSAHR
ncbi:hypothetical protein CIB48_g312 [Xylaria polymorpha]|nr:hypothetical protein CIB48_g312 [Xylaria polymorpha]